jgi:hypothetical protein
VSGNPQLQGVPKPESDAELEIVSAHYFGFPLHLRRLDVSRGGGSYEVEEDFDSYDPFHGDYDAHRRFWDWAMGPLSGGGTARASYGRFRCGHRQGLRLQRWMRSRRLGNGSSVRPTFAKVSRANNGLGENTPNRADRGVL